MWSYLACKVLAERAAWDYAEKNPTLDLATSAFVNVFAIITDDQGLLL
jgi:hypothetical protein